MSQRVMTKLTLSGLLLAMNCVMPVASWCGFSDWDHVKGNGDTNLTLVFRDQSMGMGHSAGIESVGVCGVIGGRGSVGVATCDKKEYIMCGELPTTC